MKINGVGIFVLFVLDIKELKKMKKQNIFLNISSFLSLFIFCLFGYQSFFLNRQEVKGVTIDKYTLEEYFEFCQDMLNEASSFEGTLDIEVEFDNQEEKLDIFIQNFAEKQISAYSKIDYTIPISADIQITTLTNTKDHSHIWLEEIGKEVNLYKNRGLEWTEITYDKERALQTIQMYDAPKNFNTLMHYGMDFEILEQQFGIITVEGVLAEENIYETMKETSFLSLMGLEMVDSIYYQNLPKIPVILKLEETGTPISFELDMTEAITVFLSNLLEIPIEALPLKNVLLSQTFEEWNKDLAIEIPLKARDGINYEAKFYMSSQLKQ